MRKSKLEQAAIRVAAALGEDECALIGGLAVAAYGYVRATADVDFVVPDLARARKRLQERGLSVELRRGDFSCLKGKVGEVEFDVLPAIVPIRWDESIRVPLGRNAHIRVVDLESLVRLKLKAAGPQDLMDIASLVLRHPHLRERTEELGDAYRIRDKLDVWLNDPRLRSGLEEAAPRRRRPRPRAKAATKSTRRRRRP
jgi:hypothetical protein